MNWKGYVRVSGVGNVLEFDLFQFPVLRVRCVVGRKGTAGGECIGSGVLLFGWLNAVWELASAKWEGCICWKWGWVSTQGADARWKAGDGELVSGTKGTDEGMDERNGIAFMDFSCAASCKMCTESFRGGG